MTIPVTLEKTAVVGQYGVAQSVRASEAPTASYVAGTVLDVGDFKQVTLLVAYSQNTTTSVEVKIEWSDDNSTFYREATESAASGVVTTTPAEWTNSTDGNFAIRLPVAARYIKASFKTTGSVGSDTVAAVLVKGWAQ
jgi:hypothetical protein